MVPSFPRHVLLSKAPIQMTISERGQQRLLFGVLCLVWGTTWLAMKTGIAAVPPGVFSGLRWTSAGLILLAIRTGSGKPVGLPPRLWVRMVCVALLMITLNAAIQLYGLRHIGSGLASVLTSGVTPVALLCFAMMGGQERFSSTQAVAIGLGLAGIVVLFGPATWTGDLGATELGGAALVLVGCLCYCGGSVLVRPVMRTISPAQVAAVTNLIGGVTLLVGSLAFEPGAWPALSLNWGWKPWLAWWFLLLPGSLGASIIYFKLVRDWGASKAGTYSFISPVIAVALGMVVNDERLHFIDAIGMVLMLGGAAVALRRI